MKINKIIISLAIILTLTLVGGCSSNNKTQEKEEANVETKVEEKENKSTYDKIADEYNKNFEAIKNNEKIKDLSGEDVNKEYVISKAKEAEASVLEIENNTDKMVTIQRIVTLDDIVHNISKETVVDILNYIIEEYEINKLRGGKNTLQYLYLTTFLEKALNEYDELKFAEDMLFDMNTICKDTIRQLDLRSIQANVDQVNEVINDVKNKINN